MVEENRMDIFPLIPLRALVTYPRMVLSFSVRRASSLAGLKEAGKRNGRVFLVAQKDRYQQELGADDLYPVGVVAKISQVLALPGGLTHVVAEGLYRARILDFDGAGDCLAARVLALDPEDEPEAPLRQQARIRLAIDEFKKYQELHPKQAGVETIIHTISPDRAGLAADAMAAGLELPVAVKQEILEELDGSARLERVTALLHRELDVLSIQKEIKDKARANMDKAQKEYYLREQLKVIREELGDADDAGTECEALRQKIAAKNLPEPVAKTLEKEVRRLGKLQSTSPEANTVRTYVETLLGLPWTEEAREDLSLSRAERILEADHYGMKKVKERILEHLAVRAAAPTAHTPILCLVGPPGTGKTSIARSVAKSLNRPYVRMSLGGVKDEAEIRGHRRTYVGAMPGRMIAAMAQAGVANPLLLLDEVDKLSSSYNGDPASALLEVLDAEQNFSFRDHYVELPYDLSKVFFMCTANSLETIPGPLRDRMEIIEVSGYTGREKREIALKHLIPKQLAAHGLNGNALRFTPAGVDAIIDGYTREAGVRQLEREIESVCRKVVKARQEGSAGRTTLTEKNVEDFLGREKRTYDRVFDRPQVGVTRGLAWTMAGGDTLTIEAAAMPGTGRLLLTGNLGKVMEESARAALTYVRAESARLNIDSEFYKNTDLHLHVPEGATPKDGPSAGITMATALVSALSGVPVDNLVAMTGEVTLTGRVLPIGGLREKVLAARRAGVQRVLLPEENRRDLDELPEDVKEGLTFCPVSHMTQVWEQALTGEVWQ